MKIKSISIAVVGCAAMLLSSCVTDAGVWGASVSYSSPSFSSTVAWTNASYDVNGFPIYGYAYGRPVYGYTAAGVAIFTIAALTAWCYVPDWDPAPWYHGPHHHPHHCHHVPAPPKYAPGHHPHHRPSGGMHAPIHKNPTKVLGKPLGHDGKPKYNARPDSRPNHNVNQRPNNQRPIANGPQARPNNNRNNANLRPQGSTPNRQNANRPNMSRPSTNVQQSRPKVQQSRPQLSRPSTNVQQSRPQVSRPRVSQSRPSVSRPSVSRPNVSQSRPRVNRSSGGSSGRIGGNRRR